MSTIKRDCFAYESDIECKALTKMDCEKCSFYKRKKTKEECMAEDFYWPPIRDRHDPFNLDLIKQYRQAGMTYHHIARKMHCAVHSVYGAIRRMRDAGIAI